VTDPSPRAGFTVGSPAEVERSLLPLPPPFPPPFYSFSITKVSPTLPPRFDPLPLPPSPPSPRRPAGAPRRAYTSYSITGNLSLFSRCPYPYLSFVSLSIVLRFLRHGANGLVAVTCGSRCAVANAPLFAPRTTPDSPPRTPKYPIPRAFIA